MIKILPIMIDYFHESSTKAAPILQRRPIQPISKDSSSGLSDSRLDQISPGRRILGNGRDRDREAGFQPASRSKPRWLIPEPWPSRAGLDQEVPPTGRSPNRRVVASRFVRGRLEACLMAAARPTGRALDGGGVRNGRKNCQTREMRNETIPPFKLANSPCRTTEGTYVRTAVVAEGAERGALRASTRRSRSTKPPST